MAKIAAQLYTVRQFTQTIQDFAETCRKVKEMGYDGVQLSAIGPLDSKDVKKVLDDNGLACPATHFSLDSMENEFGAFVEKHHLWGCQYPAIGGFFPTPIADFDLAHWQAFVQRFNAIAKRLAAEGLILGYHNHSHEFARIDGNLVPFQLLFNELDPASTWFEIDTYWVAAGGAEPTDWIRKVAHRIPCIHFKDMTIHLDDDPAKNRTPEMAEIGDGNLNWPGIVEACRYAGVQWYIVERDRGPVEAFASLARSIQNMRNRMGL